MSHLERYMHTQKLVGHVFYPAKNKKGSTAGLALAMVGFLLIFGCKTKDNKTPAEEVKPGLDNICGTNGPTEFSNPEISEKYYLERVEVEGFAKQTAGYNFILPDELQIIPAKDDKIFLVNHQKIGGSWFGSIESNLIPIIEIKLNENSVELIHVYRITNSVNYLLGPNYFYLDSGPYIGGLLITGLEGDKLKPQNSRMTFYIAKDGELTKLEGSFILGDPIEPRSSYSQDYLISSSENGYLDSLVKSFRILDDGSILLITQKYSSEIAQDVLSGASLAENGYVVGKVVRSFRLWRSDPKITAWDLIDETGGEYNLSPRFWPTTEGGSCGDYFEARVENYCPPTTDIANCPENEFSSLVTPLSGNGSDNVYSYLPLLDNLAIIFISEEEDQRFEIGFMRTQIGNHDISKTLSTECVNGLPRSCDWTFFSSFNSTQTFSKEGWIQGLLEELPPEVCTDEAGEESWPEFTEKKYYVVQNNYEDRIDTLQINSSQIYGQMNVFDNFGYGILAPTDHGSLKHLDYLYSSYESGLFITDLEECMLDIHTNNLGCNKYKATEPCKFDDFLYSRNRISVIKGKTIWSGFIVEEDPEIGAKLYVGKLIKKSPPY